MQLRARPKYAMRNDDDIYILKNDDTQIIQQLIRKLVDYVSADTSNYFYNMIDKDLGDQLGNPFERACVQIGIELASQYSGALGHDATILGGPVKKLDKLTCPICHQFQSESRSVICQHLRTPHIVRYRAMQCNICNVVISSRSEVVNHYLIEHKVAPIMPPPRRSFDCPFCPYQVTSRQSFTKHILKCQILHETVHSSNDNYQELGLHDTFNYLNLAYPPLDELLRGSMSLNAPTARTKRPNAGCNAQKNRVERSDPCFQGANPLDLLNRNEMSILGATMQLLEPLLSATKTGELHVPEITESLLHQIQNTFMNKPTTSSKKAQKYINTARPSMYNESTACANKVNQKFSYSTESAKSSAYNHSNSKSNLRSVVGHANSISPLTSDHLLSITELKDIFQESNVHREIDFVVQTLSGLDTRINWYVDTKVSEVRSVGGKCAFCDNPSHVSDIVNHYRSAHEMQIKHFQNNRVCIICAAIMPDVRTLLMHQQIVHQMVPMCSTERIIQFHLCKIEPTNTGNQEAKFNKHSSNQYSKDLSKHEDSEKQILTMSIDHFHQHDSSNALLKEMTLGRYSQRRCDAISPDSSHLKASKSDSNNTSTDSSQIKQFFCKKCGLTGLDLDELCQHLDDEHGVELRLIQRCDICGANFRRGKTMSDHNREHLETASIPVEKLDIAEFITFPDNYGEENIPLTTSSDDCAVIIVEPDTNAGNSSIPIHDHSIHTTLAQPHPESGVFQFDEIVID